MCSIPNFWGCFNLWSKQYSHTLLTLENKLYSAQTCLPLHLEFSHLSCCYACRLQSADGGPSCTFKSHCTPQWHPQAWQARPPVLYVMEQSYQSKAWLSSNPDASNRNTKKTEHSLFRGPAVCCLSLLVCVISPQYTVTAPVLRESYLLGSQ